MKKELRRTDLTELESHLLSLVWRNQPTTAYRIRKIFGQSPTQDIALGQGSVYPAVERLKSFGYISSKRLEDRRGTEQLRCTAAGEAALKNWLFRLPGNLPDDPLRTRVLALSVLDMKSQMDWVRLARTALLEDLAQVDEFASEYRSLLFDFAHDNARSSLIARIRWLERVEQELGGAPGGSRA